LAEQLWRRYRRHCRLQDQAGWTAPALVWPVIVEVADVLPDEPAQVFLAKQQRVTQAFSPKTSDEALALLGCPLLRWMIGLRVIDDLPPRMRSAPQVRLSRDISMISLTVRSSGALEPRAFALERPRSLAKSLVESSPLRCFAMCLRNARLSIA
jgi:hypothetical protein